MLEPVPFSSRALIFGVSGGARGHVSLISDVVRVCWLTGFSQCGAEWRGCCENVCSEVFLLITAPGLGEWGPETEKI